MERQWLLIKKTLLQIEEAQFIYWASKYCFVKERNILHYNEMTLRNSVLM